MNKFQMNFELFYNYDKNTQTLIGFDEDMKQFSSTRTTITRVFNHEHVKSDEEMEEYVKESPSKHSPIKITSTQQEVEITQDEFKRVYRKYNNTRLHSVRYAMPKFADSSKSYRISVAIDCFRGPVPVIIAYTQIETDLDVVGPSSSVIDEIQEILKINLPNSIGGKITGLTPLKLSVSRMGYNIPFTKLLPRFASKKYCQKLTELLDDSLIGEHLNRWNNTKLLFEYKWIKIPTGVILVHERFGELVNPITGNKIDSMYVEHIWPAFSTDDLLNVLRCNDSRWSKSMVFYGVGNAKFNTSSSLSIPNNYIRQLIDMLTKPFKICPIEVERKLSNYYAFRIKYISDYERLRETKRSLSNLNK